VLYIRLAVCIDKRFVVIAVTGDLQIAYPDMSNDTLT